jgi:cytochrome c-type biogenesis protein CcmF
MTVLGNMVLVAALLAAAGSAFFYFRAALGPALPLNTARTLVRSSATLIVFASLLLLTLLLRHDFSNGYVYSYSDRALPLHFLIAAFYAGQEGSFLFWSLCAALLALVLQHTSRRNGNERWVMAAYMTVQTGLLLLLATKSPFRTIWEMIPGVPPNQVPVDGRGLNPLLQNFWMVIHPPVLFVGFAAMAAPFSLAVAGLWKRDYAILPSQGFPWVLFASSVLGLGIMLGGYWAYGVLGWGGYWAWDPVENSSLVPWLTAMGLLHTMLAQLRTQKYVRTNFFLALLSFFLVVYSTFLTRSGILGDASVHSFSDPGAAVYWLLLTYLVLILAAGIVLMVRRAADMKPAPGDTSILTRETALGLGTIVILLSATVVLFGTSLPIFSAIRVEPSFYDTTNLPIAIVMVLLIGYSLYMQWEMQDGIATLRRSATTLGLTVIGGGALWFAGVRDAGMLLFACSALFAFLVNLEVGYKVAKGDPRFLGGKIAHIGLALFFLGVISTGKYSTTQHAELPIGEARVVVGRTMTYVGQRQLTDGKTAFDVEVREGESSYRLSPVMFSAGEQGVMRNPDIASFLLRDIYISPLSLEQPGQTALQEDGRYTIGKGQSTEVGGVRATFVRFNMGEHNEDAMVGGGGMAVGSVVELKRGAETETVTPVAVYRQGAPPQFHSVASKLLGATIQLVGLNVGMGGERSTVTFAVLRTGDRPAGPREVLVVDASVKPFINLLWGGTVVMMVGFALAIAKRAKEA